MGRHSSSAYQRFKGRFAVATLRLLAALPFALNRRLGALLGGAMALLPTPARRVTRINLAHCFPDMPDDQRKQLTRRSLVETGKGMAEIALLWHRPEAGLSRVRAEDGTRELHAAVAAGEPVVLLVPHLGCWEVLNFWLSTHFPFHAMFNPSGLGAMDALIKQGREHYGSTLHPATARGVVGLVRALKDGAVTAILPDQVADRRSGRFAPFFGQPAFTGTLSSKLISQSGARVFMAWGRRLPGTGGYEVRVRDPDPDIYSDDLDKSLAALNRSVEKLILEAPEQYLWSYKRFRRTPPGGERLY